MASCGVSQNYLKRFGSRAKKKICFPPDFDFLFFMKKYNPVFNTTAATAASALISPTSARLSAACRLFSPSSRADWLWKSNAILRPIAKRYEELFLLRVGEIDERLRGIEILAIQLPRRLLHDA